MTLLLRTTAILIVSCLQAACVGSPPTERERGEVNITSDNSEVWVRSVIYPSPASTETTLEAFVARDSLGYQVDSDVIVVRPGTDTVRAVITGSDVDFVLYAYVWPVGSAPALDLDHAVIPRGERDDAHPLGIPDDGWKSVEISPHDSRAFGSGASGNVPNPVGTSRTVDLHLSGTDYEVGFVAVPRYQFWSAIDGHQYSTVQLTCRDAKGAVRACSDPERAGTDVRLATPARAYAPMTPTRLEDRFDQRQPGGYYVRLDGNRLTVRWQQPPSDREPWLFSGSLYGSGPFLSDLIPSIQDRSGVIWFDRAAGYLGWEDGGAAGTAPTAEFAVTIGHREVGNALPVQLELDVREGNPGFGVPEGPAAATRVHLWNGDRQVWSADGGKLTLRSRWDATP